MRWCKVFPGQEDQIPEVATFVAQLLGSHPDRDPIASCAAELAANAIRHTASGQNGFFATEVMWTGQTVQVAVSDDGADTAPVTGPLTGPATGPFTAPSATRPASQPEHGLGVLARMSSRWGTEGDYRGRVVWAQFLASTDLAERRARAPRPSPRRSRWPRTRPRPRPPTWPSGTRAGTRGSGTGPGSGGPSPGTPPRPRP